MSNIDENKIREEAEKHLTRCRPGDWNHALRVVKWIKELGKDRPDLWLITTAGYIHDIGWEGIFPEGKEKITFDQLLQFEEQANKNSEKFATDFLKELNFSQSEIEIVNRFIKAADEHESENGDEAVIVDADQLSKLDIDHLKEKYRQSEWMKMYKMWSNEFAQRMQTQKAKELYPDLLLNLKESIQKELQMPPEQKTKVLMLDDEKLLLDLYTIAFQKGGYEVSTYYDVDDALLALREGNNPDVILFDITMPDSRSGYEFIETVKKEGLAKQSLKIALTNAGQEGEIGRIAELGTDAHLLKSNFIPSEIVTTVTEMLKDRARESGRR